MVVTKKEGSFGIYSVHPPNKPGITFEIPVNQYHEARPYEQLFQAVHPGRLNHHHSTTSLRHNTQAKRPTQPEQAQAARQKPSINLPEKANGQRAVNLLKASGKMSEFARFYGMNEEQVRQMFLSDSTAFVDKTGALHYVEPMAPEPIDTPVAPNTGANQASFPLDQTFFLESKPGSTKTLFLDFDGHVTQGTAWNNSYGIASINSPAFDLDGNPNTFNSTELTRIQNIWKRVSEDYAPFDINVTTKDPGVDAIIRSSSSDNVFGSHQVITRDFTKATNNPCGCGGFAYVGVFDFTGGTYKPAFVFYDNLASNERYIAEATSHEAGHNMGLSHDGTSTTGYYTGHGSGETGWAPIMGVGYYKLLVQWSKGEYANANQKQDDYLVMQQNSLYFDADEYGDTINNAQRLTPDVSNGFANFALQGTLQGPNDNDMFMMNLGAGLLQVDAKPFILSPNTDIQLTLLDASGNALASANPLETLASNLSFNIPSQGNYYLRVEGTGKGDPMGTGYTKYGSIGIYTLNMQGELPGPVAPTAPVAQINHSSLTGNAPLSVTFDASGSYDANDNIISYNWNFGDGSTAAGMQVNHTYQTIGQFNAVLTVNDSTGLSGTDGVTVVTTEPEALPGIGVGGISMEGVVRTKGRNVQYSADGLVLITDTDGNCLAGATIRVQWTGAVNSSAEGISSCTTTSTGGGGKGGGKPNKISGTGTVFSSPNSNNPGTFSLTVTDVLLNGYKFAPGTNDQNSVTVQ